MRVLLDATTAMAGGGIQAALAILSHMARHDLRWHAVLSESLASECPAESLNALSSVRLVPGRGVARILSARRLLRDAYRSFRPDVAFTAFGPAYWVPSVPHVQGFARGHMIYPEAIGRFPLRAQPRIYLHNTKDRIAVCRGDRFVAESRTVKERLCRIAHIAPERVAVIPNTYSPAFDDCLRCVRPRPVRTTKLILVPAAYYIHKNLDVVPQVALRLQQLLGVPFRFVLTIPAGGKGWHRIAAEASRLGVERSVRTLGPVPHAAIARLYRLSDVVFLPTWLESSTATYPEAFAAGVPLVTSDLDFAHELCADGALFIGPFDPDSAADALARVLTDAELRESLIQRGRTALATNYISPDEKWRRQLLALEATARRAPFPDELL